MMQNSTYEDLLESSLVKRLAKGVSLPYLIFAILLLICYLSSEILVKTFELTTKMLNFRKSVKIRT